MDTRQKLWIATGVVAVSAGVVTGRLHKHVWPTPRIATDVGEMGEAGERLSTPSVEQGESGEAGAATEGGASAASDEGGEHGAAPAAKNGSFDAVLAAVLGGEGGKDGLGLTPMTNNAGHWSFNVPALTGPELLKAVAGNSIRSERHFAMYLSANGDYNGWSLSWSKGSMAQCPTGSGPNYGVYDGECWVGRENPLTGRWVVKGDLLCLTPAPVGVTRGQNCVRTALMLNSLVFFDTEGQMIGKGADLLPSKNVARERSS
jgi:hypothetical protein